MSIHAAVPLTALPVLAILLVMVLRTRRIPARPFLMVYLLSSAVWALGSVALHSGYFGGHSATIGWFLPLAGVWTVAAYCHSICAFTGRRVATWTVVGYALVATVAALAVQGYGSQAGAIAEGAESVGLRGVAWYVSIAAVLLLSVVPVFYLVHAYRTAMDAQTGNKAAYLVTGALLAGLFSVRLCYPSLLAYPVEHIGHTASAALIIYGLGRSELADFRSIARKGLVYLSASLLVAPLYLMGFSALYYFAGSWTEPVSIATAIGMAFVLPWLLTVLHKPIQRAVDRVLYGDRLHYRQMVLSFPRRMANSLSLEQLAEGMLQCVPRAVDASHVSLLLAANGEFTTWYTGRLWGGEDAEELRLPGAGPVVTWLATTDLPLPLESIESELKGLSDEERVAIRAANIGLLVPMNSRGKLVGILAVGRKPSGRPYSCEDIGLLARVCGESAAAVGNAQIYAETKERAHTDELTGLLNHGYFHQRMDEEISRCSRYGNVFSVIFLDVDLFKSYNDAFGHLAGDDVLRQISRYIKESIRGIDIAFRYGGDEFAVILPESALDDARYVAERIRQRIESEMESRGMALTCSIGIAAWPTDGAMRERLLQAADCALYLSKQKGRNQISLASEAKMTQEPGHDAARETEVLSAVHALAATVDAKDANTYGHSKKASDYAVSIAQALGYPADRLTVVKASALLHDIGKIRVPDRILVKPGPLSDDEWLAIREHPRFGVSILKHIEGLSGCLPIIQHHHERFDGTGYPAGLTSSEIPIDARILAVADAYDAMTSPRPYRSDRLSHQEAIEELARCAGTHFDPEIVRTFERLWEPLDSQLTASGVTRRPLKRSSLSRQRVLELLPYVAERR
jgi:diguanylate cyclase (GGDEF)-like protein/putative nucleotidyltransferase with HDIG domain